MRRAAAKSSRASPQAAGVTPPISREPRSSFVPKPAITSTATFLWSTVVGYPVETRRTEGLLVGIQIAEPKPCLIALPGLLHFFALRQVPPRDPTLLCRIAAIHAR